MREKNSEMGARNLAFFLERRIVLYLLILAIRGACSKKVLVPTERTGKAFKNLPVEKSNQRTEQ
jgi:hypothetical protein